LRERTRCLLPGNAHRSHSGAMAHEPRKPGDLIVDRYLPDADDAMRELAHENLRRLGRALIQSVVERIRAEAESANSPNPRPGGTISVSEV
jgi:hypothetical protein